MEDNAAVLYPVAEIWTEVFDFEGSGNTPRTLPLHMVRTEVDWGGGAVWSIVIALLFSFNLFTVHNPTNVCITDCPTFNWSGHKILAVHAGG